MLYAHPLPAYLQRRLQGGPGFTKRVWGMLKVRVASLEKPLPESGTKLMRVGARILGMQE